ncbi:unnamed protein product [Effrenium voratum]|nr:unnamed protein product [Effrenium voratum]CAJ1439937.1 unnamed protein product [Effrenium voratum]
MGGPPCGSYVFINRSTSRRSRARPFGDCRKQYVRDANAVTCRFVLAAMLAIVRNCEFLCEQPRTSLMQDCPYIRFLAMVIQPVFWGSVSFPMGAFGHKHRKQTVCFGTSKWQSGLRRRLTKKDKKRIAKAKLDEGSRMVTRTICKRTGRPQVQGGPGMRASAEYPQLFGREIARLQLQARAASHGLDALPVPPPGDLEPTQAPFRWRHARLLEVRAFLRRERDCGSYRPVLEVGLDD